MKFLVIGLGSIGTRHARNLLAMGHEVWGWDPDEKTRLEARKFGVNARALEGDKIDAQIIASPTACHLSGLADAITLGQHVFVEKPIADKPNGVAEILAEAKRKNLVVMVGNMLRFHPNVKLAKLYIQQPSTARFWVLQKNDKYKESVLLNWGAHEIDLALYLFGPAVVTYADVSRVAATVSLLYDNGIRSSIAMDYLTEPEVRRFEVLEENGNNHEVNLTLHNWDDIYIEEMQAFVNLIEGKPDLRCATGEDGLATLKLISEAQRIACAQS